MGLLDQIKAFEGYSDKPYWDQKQYTSGYGTRASGPDEIIDRATAETRLHAAIDQAAAHVDAVNPNLPAGARDALISLTYNAGPGWANAGLGDLVRKGDLEGAQARLLEYNKAGGQVNPGLVKRRAAEAAWFGGAAPQQPVAQPAPVSPLSPFKAAPQPPLQIAPQAAPAMGLAAPQPQQAAPQQQAAAFDLSQMAAEQMMPQAQPILGPPRKPIDLRALRAALARPSGGLFNARG